MTVLTSLAEIVSTIDAVAVSGRRTIVAIVGAPGAGKSTVAADLVASMPRAALLPMDGFHLPQSSLVKLGRRDRMGAPDTFDVDGFVSVLGLLRDPRSFADGFGDGVADPDVGNSGDRVSIPGFDRQLEEPIPHAAYISPEISTVLVEGNYLLLDEGGWERAAYAFDVTFFVEIDDELRRERLIARHQRFGKTAVDARAWALGPDERNAAIIQATRARADHGIRLG